ncbi:MAG: putative molybdenum cofactor biosynthesis pathway protein [Monoraphidium minutum]|nr:MAG: putative molybdenum cofactor biosynthesis pathway protein [Monoraphidium minutum]
MVDVSPKQHTAREARASCRVLLGREAFELVQSNSIKKGDVLTVAQLAGIMGAKHTALLIPLCHSLLLSKVDVRLALDAPSCSVAVTSAAVTVGQTGVEMEALTAAAVAALTVYDMCKAVAKDARITDLRLDYKSGGKSGVYIRDQPAGAPAA